MAIGYQLIVATAIFIIAAVAGPNGPAKAESDEASGPAATKPAEVDSKKSTADTPSEPGPAISSLPEDPFFDRYLPLDEFALAYGELNSDRLADLAISASEGERILFRPRHGLPTNDLWSIAIKTAQATGNKAALSRLAASAGRLGKKDQQSQIQASIVLVGSSRAADDGVTVNPLEVSDDDFEILKDYSRGIQRAALSGNDKYLSDIERNLEQLFPENPSLRESIKRRLDELRKKDSSIQSLDPQVAGRMEVLLADSRFDFPKVSLPKIPTPNIPIPKIPTPNIPKPRIPTAEELGRLSIKDAERAAQKARDDAARAATKAREDAQREAARVAAGLSVEAWGEAGRAAYPAAAATMAARYAQRRQESLSSHDRAVLASLFGNDTLKRAVVIWGVSPVNEWHFGDKKVNLGGAEAEAQTYGYKIYVRGGKKDYDDRARLKILIHELTHVKQYEKFGRRLDNFGYHYFKKYKQANQNYENNGMEKEAYNNENTLIEQVYASFNQRAGGIGK